MSEETNEGEAPAAPETTPQPATLGRNAQGAMDLLLRQDREVRERAQALKAREAELERSAAWKADPLAYMRDNNLTVEQLQEQFAKSNDPNQRVVSEVEQLRAKIQELEARQQSDYTAKAWEEQAQKVEGWVSQNSEKFPHLAALGAHGEVVELQKLYHQQRNEFLSEEDAAKLIEDRYSQLAERLRGIGAPQGSNTPPDPVLSNDALGEVTNRNPDSTLLQDPDAFARAFLRSQRS